MKTRLALAVFIALLAAGIVFAQQQTFQVSGAVIHQKSNPPSRAREVSAAVTLYLDQGGKDVLKCLLDQSGKKSIAAGDALKACGNPKPYTQSAITDTNGIYIFPSLEPNLYAALITGPANDPGWGVDLLNVSGSEYDNHSNLDLNYSDPE